MAPTLWHRMSIAGRDLSIAWALTSVCTIAWRRLRSNKELSVGENNAYAHRGVSAPFVHTELEIHMVMGHPAVHSFVVADLARRSLPRD